MKKALGRASSLLGGMKYLLSTCNCLSQIFPFSQIINSLENRAMFTRTKIYQVIMFFFISSELELDRQPTELSWSTVLLNY